MRTLTRWEVEELCEQLALRPTSWMGKDKLWVRRRDGVNQFALKMVNGLPNDMSTLYIKLLDDSLVHGDVERYVEWLLEKFSSYGWRIRVEEYLSIQLAPGVDSNIFDIAREICSPKMLLGLVSAGGVIENPQVVDLEEDAPLAPKMETVVLPPAETKPIRERPRFLRNLLK